MNGSKLVGRTVKRVFQHPTGSDVTKGYQLVAIEFEGGAVLRFMAVETEAEPEVHGIFPARPIDIRDVSRTRRRREK